ncbi:MAG: helicase-associated domain-containing protein [Anaerolineae bacterium]
MPTLETLTEADFRNLLREKSLRRAREYVQRVLNPVRSGRTLTAQVQGSQLYEVEIDVEPDGIYARCTCPYDWGGYCKHIGAVLLKWVQSPQSFAVQEPAPSGETLLEVTPVEPPPPQRPATLPFWMTGSCADRQRAEDQQLTQWLARLSLRDLRQIADQRGWKIRGTQKAAVVGQIAERITDPEEVLRAFQGLDEEHRRVLRALVLLGEEPGLQVDDVGRVAQAWGELRGRKKIETYVKHLCDIGLALPGDFLTNHIRPFGFVPRPIVRRLPPLLASVIPASDEPAGGSADELQWGDPSELTRSAVQVIEMLEHFPSPLRPPMPRPSLEKFYPGLQGWDYDPDELLQARKSGKLSSSSVFFLTLPPPRYALPDETVRRLAPVAGGEERLEFLFSLLVAAGVFQPGSPVTLWPEVKAQFLSQDDETRQAILVRTYFQMSNWSELWLLLRRQPAPPLRLWRIASRSYLTPARLSEDLVRFRHLVLRALASLPDGRWVMLEDLFRLMRILWPRFDQTVWQTYLYYQGTGSWFLTEAGSETPLNPADERHWQLAQGNFIRTLIAGPLYWLGLADLRWRDGHLSAFRLHNLADLYWDRVEAPTAPRPAAVSARPVPPEDAVRTEHHTVHVRPSAIPVQAHTLLDRIARLETATADRFVYRLDPHAVYKAFEAGATLSEILEGWEKWMPVPMPEDIRSLLTGWWEAYGRVRIYENLTVIEFGDDYALAEMKAVTSLSEHLIAEISPRLVVIPQQAVSRLVAELEAAGYTPKQTDEG